MFCAGMTGSGAYFCSAYGPPTRRTTPVSMANRNRRRERAYLVEPLQTLDQIGPFGGALERDQHRFDLVAESAVLGALLELRILVHGRARTTPPPAEYCTRRTSIA